MDNKILSNEDNKISENINYESNNIYYEKTAYNNLQKMKEDKLMDDFKIAVVYNDGGIQILGNEDDYHMTCFIKLIKEKYYDNKILAKINKNHDPGTAGLLISTLYDNIVFLNTTSDHNNKNGYLIVPDYVSDIQKRSLYRYIESIEDYAVNIIYDVKFDDGVLQHQSLRSDNKNPKEMLDKFFELNNDITIKNK